MLLINDQQSGVGTILEQSRLQGVLKGKSSGELVIDKIMADEEVKPGDRVLTSGGDQIFPKGLIIGTVDRISRGPEFLQISVKPSAALNRLEEVLVITKMAEETPVAGQDGVRVRAADILAERLPVVPKKPEKPEDKPKILNGPQPSGSPTRAGVARDGVEVPSAAGKVATTKNSASTTKKPADTGKSRVAQPPSAVLPDNKPTTTPPDTSEKPPQ